MILRKDIINIPIQENAYFLLYHKNLPIGLGPTVLLIIHNIEFLKFDCFGNKKGHYHFMNRKRIFFIETTVKLQIQKTINELKDNLDTYLQMCPSKIINNFIIDKPIYLSKLIQVNLLLNEYEDKFYKNLR